MSIQHSDEACTDFTGIPAVWQLAAVKVTVWQTGFKYRRVYSLSGLSSSTAWAWSGPTPPPLSHLLTLGPRAQHWAQLSAFLLNFISALSAATRYLSRGRMTGPLSSADRANLITGQRGMEGGEKGGEGAAATHGGLSPACQYQIWNIDRTTQNLWKMYDVTQRVNQRGRQADESGLSEWIK